MRWEDVADGAVLVIEGEVDLSPRRQCEGHSTRLRVERGLSLISPKRRFMDSSRLRLMLDATSNLDRRVHIACVPSGAVRRLIDVVLGTPTAALKLFASRGDALAAFRA